MKYLLLIPGVLLLLILIAVVRTLLSPKKHRIISRRRMNRNRCGWQKTFQNDSRSIRPPHTGGDDPEKFARSIKRLPRSCFRW